MHRLLDPDHVAAALSMLCLLGPLAYAGLLMTIHPAKFIVLMNRVMDELHRIENHFIWRHPLPLATPVRDSLASQTIVRLIGLLIAGSGVLRMAEKASWLVAN